jgi:hypothetical protein
MTDEHRIPGGRPLPDARRTADGRTMTVYRAGEDAAVRRGPRQPAAAPAARPAARPARRRARGVTAGRVVAAGAGIAAMLGLVSQMQVAGGDTAGAAPAAPTPASAASDAALLRAEQDTHPGSAADPQSYAVAAAREPIVLTPHTIVKTVGGASAGGSGGYYAAAPSYSAPAAAPVATSGGSAPH